MINIFYTQGFLLFAVISIIAIAGYGIFCWLKSDKKEADIDLPDITGFLED